MANSERSIASIGQSAAEIALCPNRINRVRKIQLLQDAFETLQFAMVEIAPPK